MVAMILGTDLSATQRREVLAAYVHRHTGNHKPAWANAEWKDGKPYPVQFADDADWLANTRFPITRGGHLSQRERFCESSPTWPLNPELRGGR